MSAIKKAIGKRLHRSSITEVRPEGHGASAANVTSELEEAMPQHLVSTLQAAGSDQSGLTGLAGLITDIIATLGPIGVGALVALETLFPPIPSELILPLSGYLASQGRMSLAMVIIGATVGSLVGALALYWAGAALGQKRLRRLAERMPLVEWATWNAPRGGSTATAGWPC
jgi:hypothetical protein